MRNFNVGDAMPELPTELVAALKVAGFSKVASQMTGVPCESEEDLYAKIGTALFIRRKEAALIEKGLASMRALEDI